MFETKKVKSESDNLRKDLRAKDGSSKIPLYLTDDFTPNKNVAQLMTTNVIQREAISKAQALANMQSNVPGIFSAVTHTEESIIEPWDNAWSASNCHGYTLEGTFGHSIDEDSLVMHITGDESISLFYRGGTLAHSGKREGLTLKHLLKNVGIVHTNASADNLLGYDERLNLPEDNVGFQLRKQVILMRECNMLLMQKVTEAYDADETAFNEKGVTGDMIDSLYEWKNKHENDEDIQKNDTYIDIMKRAGDLVE